MYLYCVFDLFYLEVVDMYEDSDLAEENRRKLSKDCGIDPDEAEQRYIIAEREFDD